MGAFDEFAEPRAAKADEQAARPVRELLVFELDAVKWAVDAHKVDSVVAWRPPSPVPEGGPALAGVVQDAGRIVAVLHDPRCAGPVSRPRPPARIVICATSRGLVGIPATTTHGIEPVVLPEGGGDTLDSSFGPVVLLDPDAVAAALASA